MAKGKQKVENAKVDELGVNREEATDEYLTTNQGFALMTIRIRSKPASAVRHYWRISSSREDHPFRSRTYSRTGCSCARSGRHGFFQVYESMAPYTKAGFCRIPRSKRRCSSAFDRRSSRGSSDLARDVRGFAVKFYTEEGNFDLVGNNIPVFFIQDG